MSKETKKTNTMNGGLYIALAICILSVICIGVYSAIINIFDGSLVEDITAPPPTSSKSAPTVVVESPETKRPVSQEPQRTEEVEAPKEGPAEAVNAIPEVTGYTRPVAGEVMNAFSDGVLVYSATMNDHRTHTGTDFYAVVGEAVKCFANGVVEKIYDHPLMGQTVVVDHGHGMKSVYQNLSYELPGGIEVGKVIYEGDVIGGVGETALIECAEEPHLHFEVFLNGAAADPMKYFK